MKIKTIQRNAYMVMAAVYLLLGGISTTGAEEAQKFLVVPFKVHADRDLSYLQRGMVDMLATRLTTQKSSAVAASQPIWDAVAAQSGMLPESEAAVMGAKYGADYIVFGSLTIFGDNVSTNAQCLEVKTKKLAVVFTQAGKTTGDVITHIHQFAGSIREKILGEKEVAESAAGAGTSALPESRRNPEAVWQETVGGVSGGGFGLPGIIRQPGTGSLGQFNVWRSPELDDNYIGLATEDLDGDRKIELVTITEKMVVVWRYDAGRLTKLYELATDRNVRFLTVDVADINQNGKAEIFVTAVFPDQQRLGSMVAELSGSSLDWIETSASMYFRVLKDPSNGKAGLYGQTWGGMDQPFSSSVYRVEWNAGSYIRTDRIALPRNTNIYSFVEGDIKGDGTRQTLAISSQATLQLENSDGTTAWTGTEGYSGTGVFVEYPSDQFEVTTKYGIMGRYYLPQRIHVMDVDGDGLNEVIFSDNVDRSGRILPRTRLFKEGRVRCLAWGQLGLNEKWQTQSLTGHISDTGIADMDNDGVQELVVAVIPPKSFSLSQPKSYIVMWKLGQK